MLAFERDGAGRRDQIGVEIATLVIAGWAGRDEAETHHHIRELSAIGVPPPSEVPLFYRVSPHLLTQSERISVLGPETSGEVEAILVSLADGLWVGLGSDHTDRKAETFGVALSKQLCAKPVARRLWRFEDVAPHWDRLLLRSYLWIAGERVLYQEGRLDGLLRPRDLLARMPSGPELEPGTVMFCGTRAAIGGIRPSRRFDMELTDDVLGRSIYHTYEAVPLPIVT